MWSLRYFRAMPLAAPQRFLMFRTVTEDAKSKQFQVEEVAKKILTKHKNFILNQTQKSNIEVLCIREKEGGQNEWKKSWVDGVISCPHLLSKNPYRLKQLSAHLVTKMNANPSKVIDFLANCPKELTDLPLEQLASKLDNWRSFSNKLKMNWLDALIEVPEVLALDSSNYEERRHEFREFFTSSVTNLAIANSPSLLFADWPQTKNKILFLFHKMHVSPEDIVHHRVLEEDLHFIQTRYEFLNRSGLYKHPGAKSIGNMARAEPPINLVIHEDIEIFLKKAALGQLTHEEFNTFLGALEEEKEFGNPDSNMSEGFYEAGHQEMIEEQVKFKNNYNRNL